MQEIFISDFYLKIFNILIYSKKHKSNKKHIIMNDPITIFSVIAFGLYFIYFFLSDIAFRLKPSKTSRILYIIKWIVLSTASIFLSVSAVMRMIIPEDDTKITFLEVFILAIGILIFCCGIVGLRKSIKDNDSQKWVIFSILKKFWPKSEFNLIKFILLQHQFNRTMIRS